MQNIIPMVNPELLTLGGEAAIGAAQYGAAIPLLQNTEANIRADIIPLVDAIMACGEGAVELSNRRATVRNLVKTSRVFLALGRDSFKPELGNDYNQSWDTTGLVGSLAIPYPEELLLQLLRSFKGFMESNPAFELPTKNMTATRAEELFTQLEAARGAVNLQQTVAGQLTAARDEKATALRRRLRGLIAELNQRIDPLDVRWKAFGFNMPGADETPDAPENITVTLIGPTAAAVKWPASARAAYYRVWKKVVGVDAEPVAVGSPADLDFTIEELPANSSIELSVSAVNNGGESPLSKAVTIVTH